MAGCSSCRCGILLQFDRTQSAALDRKGTHGRRHERTRGPHLRRTSSTLPFRHLPVETASIFGVAFANDHTKMQAWVVTWSIRHLDAPRGYGLG